MEVWGTVLVIFVLTVIMIMSGRGGGNFYVAALVLSGVPMHTASTTSQFILLVSAFMGAVVFGKAKTMSWPLVLFFGSINASMAFCGGLSAHAFAGDALKLVLAFFLFIAGIAMLFPEKQTKRALPDRFGYWIIRDRDNQYVINLWVAIPLTATAGFFSGMVGISGGAFLIPLMVVGCGVPMRIAVGTATAMLAATALAGFSGNAIHGGFDANLAVPCGVVAVIGGWLGSKIALKSKPEWLKQFSAVLTLLAAALMAGNVLC